LAIGGASGVNDIESTDIGNIALTASEPAAWKNLALSPSAIQEIVWGTWATNWFLMKPDTENSDLYDLGEGANAPYMLIDYSLGGRVAAVFLSDFGYM
jgi:hypothetical protein